ncbi:MAG: ATP-dependent ligase [Acidimicrobiales bacterium]|jgi:ATP-dependent DNA ligase|nr:ATP-dependent ligase [Acidimicrobiales bacterium]
MDLPVMPPVKPMLAKLARALPPADGVSYEPKWDGFRTIVFRDGDEIELGSRNERPLTRYFPEILDPLRANLPARCVIDGELVVAGEHGLDFDAMLQRIHPAESRVRMLAEKTPASFVAFDLLAIGDEDLRSQPFRARRARLADALRGARPPVHLTPTTGDAAVATDWFDRFEGAGLDGVIVKNLDQPYREDERVMLKVKHQRTVDCVVAGFRWHKSGGIIGSLLLGLYSAAGDLQHVGVTAAFTAARRRELVDELAPYREHALEGHPWAGWAEAMADAGGRRMPGAGSRWNAGKDLSWEAVRPELVCEVAFEHMQGDRFRHAARFVAWRPDRDPRSCTYDQLEVVVPEELARVFGA